MNLTTYMDSAIYISNWKRFIYIFFLCSFVYNSSLFAQTASISVNGQSVANGGSTTVCSSTGINFNVVHSGVGSSPTFLWSFQNASPASATTQQASIVFNSLGQFSVSVSVYGTDTVTASISVSDTAVISSVFINLQGGLTICYNSIPGIMSAGVVGGVAPYSYQWERKIGTGSWQNVGSNSSAYSETASLTQATNYRVTASSSGNCGSVTSGLTSISALPIIASASISAAQTICHNTTPSILTRTNASGGDGSFAYQWQYSTNGTSNWQSTGQTGITYNSGGLTSDRWFRVESSSSCGLTYSNSVKITVRAALSSGTISPSNPQICYNTSQALTLSATSGADGVYSYIWETKPVGAGTWALAPGSSSSTSYSTGSLTQSAEYRVRVNSGCNVESISTVRTVDVATTFAIGTISLVGPSTICYSTAPGQMSISTTGGRTPYTYQWKRKIGAGLWQNVGTNASYTESTNLLANTEYRVTVTSASGCGTLTSISNSITVLPIITIPTISIAQTICHNTIPAILSRNQASGSDGSFTYEWQYSANGTNNWQNTGQTGLSYSPGTLTSDRWFRVRVDNSCITSYSNVIKVTVYLPLSSGILGPASPQICFNTSQALSVSGTSGADATYTYIWERRLVGNTTWLPAPSGASLSAYNTGNITQSYEYRVRVNSGCGVEDITNTVSIDVAGQLGISAISLVGPSTICHSSVPGQMSVVASGGRTPYAYQWERKIGSGTWTSIGTNSNIFAETLPLTTNTQYRVTSTSSSGCGSITSSVLSVTVRPAITNAVLSGAQTICHNTNPAFLTRTNASGSDGSFSYEWEYSLTGSSPWISTSQSGMSYNPGILTSSRWFRVKIVNSTCSGLAYTNIIKVNVRNPLIAGALIPSYTETCYNTSVNLSISGTSGADTNYLRVWQRSVPGSGIWATAPGSVNLSGYNTGNLLSSFDYRVIVNSSCNVTDTSNQISIDVAPEFVGGSINIASQEDSVCYNHAPVLMTASGFNGGRLPYTYLWEKRITSGLWNIVGANQASYQDQSLLKEDAFYRLTVTSDTGCGMITTDSVKIRVIPLPSSDNSVILGPYSVCSNAQGIFYQLYPGYSDSIYWSFGSGTVLVDSADRVIVDFNDLGFQFTDTLYSYLISSKTKCERVVKIPIIITANRAPDKTDIVRKSTSNILICADSTIGMNYEWGYYQRSNGQKVTVQNGSLRYCQFASIDTVTNLYFVQTSLSGCSSTSYYSFRSHPFEVEDIKLKKLYSLYPNPSNGRVYLNGPLEKIESLRLISISGISIPVSMEEGTRSILFSEYLPQGAYVLLIQTETSIESINLSIIK